MEDRGSYRSPAGPRVPGTDGGGGCVLNCSFAHLPLILSAKSNQIRRRKEKERIKNFFCGFSKDSHQPQLVMFFFLFFFKSCNNPLLDPLLILHRHGNRLCCQVCGDKDAPPMAIANLHK